jgi:sialate O-acetylesterase
VNYNGMIAPLCGTPLRGIAWYQGESNGHLVQQYRPLLYRYIRHYREHFDSPEAVVIVQQSPSFGKSVEFAPPEGWARVREAQASALQLPHTAIAAGHDTGMHNDVHPNRKVILGERMTAAALRAMHGEPDPRPTVADITFDQGAATVRVDSQTPTLEARRVELWDSKQQGKLAGRRHVAKAGVVHGFTLAGPDRVFHPAEATLDGTTLRVTSEAVTDPTAVRYGWQNFTLANVYDNDGRPLLPFRSDGWGTGHRAAE